MPMDRKNIPSRFSEFKEISLLNTPNILFFLDQVTFQLGSGSPIEVFPDAKEGNKTGDRSKKAQQVIIHLTWENQD